MNPTLYKEKIKKVNLTSRNYKIYNLETGVELTAPVNKKPFNNGYLIGGRFFNTKMSIISEYHIGYATLAHRLESDEYMDWIKL